ncbi:hypothetical protein DsansV1_C13g0119431 [Dioscorea sansibarensis]
MRSHHFECLKRFPNVGFFLKCSIRPFKVMCYLVKSCGEYFRTIFLLGAIIKSIPLLP